MSINFNVDGHPQKQYVLSYFPEKTNFEILVF